MMRPDRIFLDMDDVLNACTLPLMNRVFQCDVGDFELDKFPVHVGYDVIRAVAILRGEDPQDPATFWRQLPPSIWAELPKSVECDWLLDKAASLVGRENVYIATAPTRCPGCYAGKIEWIDQNLPSWIHRQHILIPHKWLLGRPGWLLIDDCQENCDKWEGMGGDAIVMPRPWNPLHQLPFSLAHVNDELSRLFGA